MGILAQTPEVDALLIMHAPVALVSPTEVAGAVIDACGKTRAAILTSWVGGGAVEPARTLFHQAGIATYDTPNEAVRAFMQMVRYRRNQELLMETPGFSRQTFAPAVKNRPRPCAGMFGGGANLDDRGGGQGPFIRVVFRWSRPTSPKRRGRRGGNRRKSVFPSL